MDSLRPSRLVIAAALLASTVWFGMVQPASGGEVPGKPAPTTTVTPPIVASPAPGAGGDGAESPPPPPPELKNLLIVPVSIVNGTGTPPPAFFQQQGQKLTDRFREISYNTDIYTHTVKPMTWLWLPGQTPGCLSTHLNELSTKLLAGQGVNTADYQRVIFYWEKGSCGGPPDPSYQGGGTFQGKWIWSDGVFEPTWARFLGLLDGAKSTAGYQCTPVAPNNVSPPAQCSSFAGTQRFDLISPAWPSESPRGHPTAASKYAAGWLTQYVDAPEGSTSSFVLKPFEMTGVGTKAIRMTLPGVGPLWVEYRTGAGTDSYLASWPNVGKGVQITTGSGGGTLLDFGVATQGGTAASFQDATLPAGQLWTHPSGLTVQVVGSSPDPKHDPWVQVQVHQPVVPVPPTGVVIGEDPASNHVRVVWTAPATPFSPDVYELNWFNGSANEIIVVDGQTTSAVVSLTRPMRPRNLSASVRARFGPNWSNTGFASRPVSIDLQSFTATAGPSYTAATSWAFAPLDPWLEIPDQVAFSASPADPFGGSGPSCTQGRPFAVSGSSSFQLLGGGHLTARLRVVYNDDIYSIIGYGNPWTSASFNVDTNNLAFESFDGSYDAPTDRIRLSWSVDSSGDDFPIGYLASWCDIVGLKVHTKVIPAGSASGTSLLGPIDGIVSVSVAAIGSASGLSHGSSSYTVGYETHPVSHAPNSVIEGNGYQSTSVTVTLDQPSVSGGLHLLVPDPDPVSCNQSTFVLVPPGSSTGTMPFSWVGNTTDGPDRVCRPHELLPPQGSGYEYTVTIVDDD